MFLISCIKKKKLQNVQGPLQQMLFSRLFLSCRSLEGVKAQAVSEIFLKLINVLSAGPGLNRGAKGGIS